LRIGDFITGNNRLATQDHRTTAALERKDLRARRGNAGQGTLGTVLMGNQAKLQRRRATKNTSCLRSVLDTWQLHHDTIRTLALYHRLTDTEFVNTIVQ